MIVHQKLIGGALFVSLFIGCSAGSPTEKVSGIVTLDGAPVEAAAVTFVPDDPATGKSAAGITDKDGKFTLTTNVGGDGALPGSYKIQVTKYETPDGGHSPYGAQPSEEPEPAPNRPMTEEEENALMAQGYTAAAAGPKGPTRTQAAKNNLPAQYATIATSGLAYTVVEGDNNVTLELTTKK
jgi:hypothetical protein